MANGYLTPEDPYAGVLAQPQGSLAAAMNSPYAAMAAQGLNNISALRRNQVPRLTPVGAYQQAVMAQATANQTRRINELRIKGMEQAQDPYYEFRIGKEEGYIPEEMTWAEFQQAKYRRTDMTSPGKNLAIRNTLQEAIKNETDPQKKAELKDQLTFFENAVRAPTVFAGGGGSQYGLQPLSQDVTELVSPEVATGREAEKAKQVTGAEKWAGIDADWSAAFAESAPVMQDTIDTVEDLIRYIEENPDMPTGMLQGYVTPKTNEAVSYMQTLATLLAIPRLQEAKLNPVTELELQKIMETFADSLKDPRANIASLKASYNDLIRAAKRMESQQNYFSEKGTLKGFSTDQFKFRIPEPVSPPGTKIKGPARPGS